SAADPGRPGPPTRLSPPVRPAPASWPTRLRRLPRPVRTVAEAVAATGGTADWVNLAYLAAAVCFIVALKGLSSPKTAPRANLGGAARRAAGRRGGVPRRAPAHPAGHRGGHRGRPRGRRAGRPPAADDRDAAARRAVQRRRRRRGGPGRGARAGRPGPRLPAGGRAVHADRRIGVVQRVGVDLREAAGADARP